MNTSIGRRRCGQSFSLAMVISLTPLAAAETGAAEGIKCPYPTSSVGGEAIKKTHKPRPRQCGPRGPRGATGAKGATGARGVSGFQGVTGSAGAAGPAGTAGAHGASGVEGL